MTYLPNSIPGLPCLPFPIHSFIYSSIQQVPVDLIHRNKALIPQMAEFLRAFYWYNMSKGGRAIFTWLCLGFSLFSYFPVLHLFSLEIIMTAFLSSISIIKKKKNTLVPIATSKLTAHLGHKNLQKTVRDRITRSSKLKKKKKCLKHLKA